MNDESNKNKECLKEEKEDNVMQDESKKDFIREEQSYKDEMTNQNLSEYKDMNKANTNQNENNTQT